MIWPFGETFKKSSGEEQGVITHLCRLGRVLAPTLEHKEEFPNAESVRFELLLLLLRIVSPVSPTSCLGVETQGEKSSGSNFIIPLLQVIAPVTCFSLQGSILGFTQSAFISGFAH